MHKCKQNMVFSVKIKEMLKPYWSTHTQGCPALYEM